MDSKSETRNVIIPPSTEVRIVNALESIAKSMITLNNRVASLSSVVDTSKTSIEDKAKK